jgi:hypothetical protein
MTQRDTATRETAYAEVWAGEDFLGTVEVKPSDWWGQARWRQAALQAALREFGPGIYHVADAQFNPGYRNWFLCGGP